ncbi:hypothetical protein DVW12_11345 [Clostridium botulinum]|nr:hypothetical protein [Clostridium botulinum]
MDIIMRLSRYNNKEIISSDSADKVIALLGEINNLEIEERNSLAIKYSKNIYEIYLKLAKFYDSQNSPFNAKNFVEYYIRSILERYYKEFTVSDVNDAINILAKNSLKIFIFNNNTDELNKSIALINEFNKCLPIDNFSDDKINYYIKLLNDKSFNFMISFTIPFPIYIDKEFNICKNNEEYKLKIKLIKSNNFLTCQDNSFIGYKKDRYGLYNKSIIIIEGNIKLNDIKKVEVANYSYIVDKGIDIVNGFIDCLKLVDNFYWVQRINKYMVSDFVLEIRANEEKLYRVEYATYGDNAIFIVNSLKQLFSEHDIDKLISLFNNGYNLWESILSDSKDYYDIGKYREAIILVNNAFENYIEVYIKKNMINLIGEEETENIYEGVINYNTWKMKDKISKKEFDNLRNLGIIKNQKATSFKIFEEYRKVSMIDIKKKELNKLIRKIRNKRNDIIHGRIHNFKEIDLKNIAEEAINSFEELIKIIN